MASNTTDSPSPSSVSARFRSTRIREEFAEARTFHWSIFLLGLGMVVPATAVGAVALLRGRDLGRRALYATTGWFALVPRSVAAMVVTMLVNDDPNASDATVAVLSVASVVLAAFAVVVYRPVLSPPSTGPQFSRPVAAGPSTRSPDVPREDDETAGSTGVHEEM